MILNARRTFRGVFCNTWCNYRQSRLVKSYEPDSRYFSPLRTEGLSMPLISPETVRGRARQRHIFALPTASMRLVDLDLSQLDPVLGERISEAYATAASRLSASDPIQRNAPLFSRFDPGHRQSGPLRSCVLEDRGLRRRLQEGHELIRGGLPPMVLHGSFSIGNMLLCGNERAPCFLHDNSSFAGPVEYDLATCLETLLDLINKNRLMNIDSGHLPELVCRLIEGFERNFMIDRSILQVIVLYQYVGHLNLYQVLMRRKGHEAPPKAAFQKIISTFIKTMGTLL